MKRPAFHWLEPPASPIGTITVAEVRRAADPREDERVVRRWGADIWSAWSPHHDTIRNWTDQSLG